LTFLLCLLVITLGGCSSISNYQKSIYNDDTKIAKEADSYSYLKRVGNVKDNKVTLTFEKFNGSDTIWTINTKEDGSINVNFSADIEKGGFKAVIITADNKVSNIFENTINGSREIRVLKGKNRLKFIGDGASGEINITINLGKDMNLFSSSE
jgi:hypothetical protein